MFTQLGEHCWSKVIHRLKFISVKNWFLLSLIKSNMECSVNSLPNVRLDFVVSRIWILTTSYNIFHLYTFSVPSTCVSVYIKMQKTSDLADFLVHRLYCSRIFRRLSFPEQCSEFVVHGVYYV